MTQNEVINKLSMEMALALGDLDTLQTCKIYIQMALSIGIEHFTRDMDEVIAYTTNGTEIGRFKSVQDAADKIGLRAELITAVLNGRQCTTGGMMFMKTKDKYLIPSKKSA
jgi:hypothetical protein